MRRVLALGAAIAMAVPLGPGADASELVVGAVYPTGGSHGRGGLDEYRGVRLAAELAPRSNGGHAIRIVLEPADSADQAPAAVARLARAGVPIVIGSHGSTISRPVAEETERRGLVFWETGAVGELGMRATNGKRVFRFASTGGSLGRAAVGFVRDRLLPRMGRSARDLRFAVAYVDDEYGRSVGLGALGEIERDGLSVSAVLPYRVPLEDAGSIAARVAAARTDVLVVAAYLDDGVAVRKALVRERVPLVASIGTSSSYCMHEFGQALGRAAVGLFASDKPDGHVLDPMRLGPEPGGALRWARAQFARRYGHEMTAPALSGFAGGWALFRHVLPRAHAPSPDAIARAARAVRLPEGSLPNGSGLAFGSAGAPGGGDNVRATSVIWEWVKPRTRAIVWPPVYATSPILPVEL